MNQKDKDEAEAREYVEKISHEWGLAGKVQLFFFEDLLIVYKDALHAERTRKSEVVGTGFEEWAWKEFDLCRELDAEKFDDLQAAYVQGERAKEKELIEYKEMWQEIGGAANLKGLIKRNDDMEKQIEELKTDLKWALNLVPPISFSVKIEQLTQKHKLNERGE